MPEDSKKNQNRSKHEAKEQRKPRQPRQHTNKPEIKKEIEKKAEAPKVPAPMPPKPAMEEPGPEFYKNLKRETDEILKITEEANNKYKKKEIQSNWSKYEMPVESYEEIEEQENLGADYEKLISAPLSLGGHFQFKHEKAWDVDTGPSLYDKYFDINMENLATAISTVPFYERYGIDETLFTKTDMLTMNNRAMKYKRKYYNNKSYTTFELEVQDRIINSVKGESKPPEIEESHDVVSEDINLDSSKNTISESTIVTKPENTQLNAEVKNIEEKVDRLEIRPEDTELNVEVKNIEEKVDRLDIKPKNTESNVEVNNIEVKINRLEIKTPEPLRERFKPLIESPNKPNINTKLSSQKDDIEDIDDILFENPKSVAAAVKIQDKHKDHVDIMTTEPVTTKASEKVEKPKQDAKNPVIESPEDLEKWLDDFLDG